MKAIPLILCILTLPEIGFSQPLEVELERIPNIVINGGTTNVFAGASGGKPILYYQDTSTTLQLSSLTGEAKACSAFGCVYYEKNPTFVPKLYTSSGTTVTLSGTALPLDITDSGWIAGRQTVPVAAIIWNGSTGQSWTYSGLREFYAIEEVNGVILAAGKTFAGELVTIETTTTDPSTYTQTTYTADGVLMATHESGIVGGAKVHGSGYAAVMTDTSGTLYSLPLLNPPLPWDWVYDIEIVGTHTLAIGQAHEPIDGSHAVIWIEGFKPWIIKDFVEMSFDYASGSDTFDQFIPRRAATIFKNGSNWILCGEGYNTSTTGTEGWILTLPRLPISIAP